MLLRLLVIAGLVYAGVHLWYGVVEKRLQPDAPTVRNESAPAPPPPVQQQQPEPAPAASDVQAILTRNMFKAVQHADQLAPAATAEEQPDLDNMAQTQLRLTLLGTVTGKDEDGRAIIRDEHAKLEDLYRVGSEIQGAVISRIARGKVVLKVNNREEVLVLKEPEAGGGAGGGATGRAMTKMEPGRPMGGSNVVASPGVEASQPVPEAVPRRRISFRGDAVTPAAAKAPNQEPVATEPAPEPVDTPVEAEQPSGGNEAPTEAVAPSAPVEAGDVRSGDQSP